MTGARELLSHFRGVRPDAVRLLRRLVEMESFSLDGPAVDALAGYVAREFLDRGAAAEVIPLPGSGSAVQAVFKGRGAARPVLFLGHLDTVWPAGTVTARPFSLRDGKAFGPGIFDMKGGIAVCLLLCAAFQELRLRANGDIVFLFTPDEEIGSAASLPLLRQIAPGCRAVLCLEPPLPGGKAKTFRRGVGSFHLRVDGIAAHAGGDHPRGANAILELSRQVIRLQKMTDYERGITVSVGKVRGGTAINVVPDCAEADVDFRFSTLRQGRKIERRIREMRAQDSRCTLRFEGGINRPPLERTPAVVDLHRRAASLARSIGMKLGEGSSGGGSDGSFTAAMGVPTLDGLGVAGKGAHSVNEHILVSDVPRRAALLGLLAQELAG